MTSITSLDVFIGNRLIGNIALLPNDRSIFSFEESYVDDLTRPTLSLSFIDMYGDILTDRRPIQTQLEPFFSNLLPEGYLRKYLSEKAGIAEVREFYLMWVLGRDLSGNVIVKPSEGEEWPPFEDKNMNDAEKAYRKEQAMRFSLAGVQLKFSALISESKGLTIPAQGHGGDWIVKLPSERWKGVPENEYSMMKFAERMGMNVPDIQLVSMNDIKGIPTDIGDLSGNTLAIKRFDRDKGKRIHIEDFAQVFGLYPDRKYERGNYKNIAEVLWAEIGEEAIIEYVKRLVFNILIGNGDMHMKNWSLIYPDGQNADIAPAYDFLSTIPYTQDKDMALNLYRGGPRLFTDITQDSFIQFAAKAKLPETITLNAVKETTEKFHDLWGEAKQSLPIEERVSDAIDAHLKELPLAK